MTKFHTIIKNAVQTHCRASLPHAAHPVQTLRATSLLAILFFCASINLFAQSPPEQSTKGTDFWVSFGQHGAFQLRDPNPSNMVYLGLKIVSEKATTVTLEFTENSALERTILVGANTVTNVSLHDILGEEDAVYI